MITGLGLLIGSVIHVSGPEQVARNSVLPTRVAEPITEIVGRITGMVDCKWEKKGLGIRDWGLGKDSAVRARQVALGDRFTLSAGLMEITYDTGAKAILQGPVTYEVEANGGYLAVGKLTGKLEKKGERREERGESGKSEIRNQKSLISNPQSPIPNPFIIRTPTATVTDLGTEFGVEVTETGTTQTHVFVGAVQIATGSGQGNHGRQTQLISAGQSAWVGHNAAISVGKEDTGESAKRFARVMPTPRRLPSGDEYAKLVLSMNPAVYYRMEEWPKGKDEDMYVLVDSAPAPIMASCTKTAVLCRERRAGLAAHSICTAR